MSIRAATLVASMVGLLAYPAAGADEIWVNYGTGSGWGGAAIHGHGDTIWVSSTGGLSQYDSRTMREVGRWGPQDGLRDLHQFSVCELDPETGAVWVARESGLSRWDGHTWLHATGGSCTYALAITHDNIWAGAGNLQRFDKNGKLLKTYTPSNSSIPAGSIWFIKIDREDPNILWLAHYIHPVYQGKELGFGKEEEAWWRRPARPAIDEKHLGGLSKWDIRAEKCVAFYNPNNSKVPTNRGGVVGEDSTGHIWYSGDEPSSGIGRMDKKSGQWEIFDGPSGCPMPNWNAWSMVIDPADNVFMSTVGPLIGVRWADTGKWESLRVPPRTSLDPGLAGSDVGIGQNWNQWGPGDGRLYCSTSWGLVRYDRKSGQWAWFQDLPQVGNIRFSPVGGVACIRQDEQGQLWTAGRTLGRMDAQGQLHMVPIPECLARDGEQLKDMEIAGGTIWALETNAKGLVQYDIATGKHEYLQGDNAVKKLGLYSAQPISLSKDSKGRLWLGFEQPGVVQCYEDGHFRTYGAAETGNQLTGSVTRVREGPDGRLWLATTDALVEFDGQKWTRHPAEAGGPKLGFTAIEFDDQGNLWLLGKQVYWESRLYRFDGTKFGMPEKLGAVTMLLADAKGRIWLSDRYHAMQVWEGQQWRPIMPRKDGPAGLGYGCGFQGRDGKLYFGGCTGTSLTVLEEAPATSTAPTR